MVLIWRGKNRSLRRALDWPEGLQVVKEEGSLVSGAYNRNLKVPEPKNQTNTTQGGVLSLGHARSHEGARKQA